MIIISTLIIVIIIVWTIFFDRSCLASSISVSDSSSEWYAVSTTTSARSSSHSFWLSEFGQYFLIIGSLTRIRYYNPSTLLFFSKQMQCKSDMYIWNHIFLYKKKKLTPCIREFFPTRFLFNFNLALSALIFAVDERLLWLLWSTRTTSLSKYWRFLLIRCLRAGKIVTSTNSFWSSQFFFSLIAKRGLSCASCFATLSTSFYYYKNIIYKSDIHIYRLV